MRILSSLRRDAVIGSAIILLTLAGCGGNASGTDAGSGSAPDSAAGVANAPRDVVMTTFYPTTFFAERISGGLVPVECPLPADTDPIFWRPPADVISRYQRAGLIVLNGAEFEKWALTAPLPRSRLVNSAAGFRDRFVTMETTTHSHGPAGEHSHEGTDGHTWLDPRNAALQVDAIRDAMADAFPAHADAFAANAGSLSADLASLDERFAALTPKLGNTRLLASHPAYNYIAARYGWDISNLDLDPERELSADELASITGDAAPTVLLWESEPIPASLATLAAAGVRSVIFAPGETTPARGDYLDLMRDNLDALEAVLDASIPG
ncbi:MAG: metal ABC transporter substrate-binding protein [Planctomycetota bacterium]